MNISKDSRPDDFRALYENAKNRFAETLDALERHMRQYKGSTAIDGSSEPAATVRNITYEIVESQISSDIPLPKVDAACYSEKRDRGAKSIERLCTAVRDRLPFEEMNDIDERYTYIYGGSVWFVEWDSSRTVGGEAGGVKITCLSPKNFVPEPGVTRVSDMNYCFLRFPTASAELARRYGVKSEDLCRAENEDADEGDDTVTEVVMFYRDDDGDVGQLVFSGDLILSDLPKYYQRKRKTCQKCGCDSAACRCEHPSFTLVPEDSEWVSPLLVGRDFSDGPVEVPYYLPKDFPIVIRKNTSGEGMLFGQSDCEFLRPEQQAINKIESRILQKLLRAGVTPIVPEDATVTINNSVFGQVIRMKPGESLAQYGKVDTTPDISQDIAEAERLYQHAKRVLGITDAYQGIAGSASESGYAKELQISQSGGRLQSKKKMKHTAYADLDRLIFSYYLAFADEPRRLSYKDAFGRIHDASFNRYDFLEVDGDGNYYFDDGYLFSVDLNGGIEGQRTELWQKNLENLQAGALGDTADPMTLLRYWQSQERAHYPFARENVEYFNTIVCENEERRTENRVTDLNEYAKETSVPEVLFGMA